MTRSSIHEYAEAVRLRYRVAVRKERSRLLDEFCQTTGYHRKAAVRLLGRKAARGAQGAGRPRQYGGAVAAALEQVWLASNTVCSKRLSPFMGELVESLERHGELTVTTVVRAQLLQLSAATIDRLLAPVRQRHHRLPVTQRLPPRPLQLATPLRTWGEWTDVAPGTVQADLVLHCGGTTAGYYLATLTVVDVASGWHACRAVRGTGKQRVQAGFSVLQRQLPFPLRELHTDNGGEFLNETLVAWCTREAIKRTRGRPYRKNDQAYVEQRNWTAVRQLVGYDRYSSQVAQERMQRVYDLARLYQNFYQPVRKLTGRTRVGAKLRKQFDIAQTPYQRLLRSETLTAAAAATLAAQYERLNPVRLRQQLAAALEQLWQAADRTTADGPAAATATTSKRGAAEGSTTTGNPPVKQ